MYTSYATGHKWKYDSAVAAFHKDEIYRKFQASVWIWTIMTLWMLTIITHIWIFISFTATSTQPTLHIWTVKKWKHHFFFSSFNWFFLLCKLKKKKEKLHSTSLIQLQPTIRKVQGNSLNTSLYLSLNSPTVVFICCLFNSLKAGNCFSFLFIKPLLRVRKKEKHRKKRGESKRSEGKYKRHTSAAAWRHWWCYNRKHVTEREGSWAREEGFWVEVGDKSSVT